MYTNKQIAKQLKFEAYRLSGIELVGRVKFVFDDMTIRCKPTTEAVLAVAKKFEKRQPSYGTVMPRRPTLTRPKFSMVTLRRFTTEGDLDGAKAYAKCYGHVYIGHTIYRKGTGSFAQYYNEREKCWKTSGLVNSDIVEIPDMEVSDENVSN